MEIFAKALGTVIALSLIALMFKKFGQFKSFLFSCILFFSIIAWGTQSGIFVLLALVSAGFLVYSFVRSDKDVNEPTNNNSNEYYDEEDDSDWD